MAPPCGEESLFLLLFLAFAIYCGTEKSKGYFFPPLAKHLLHWLSQWEEILNHWNVLLITIYVNWWIVCQTYASHHLGAQFLLFRNVFRTQAVHSYSKISFIFQLCGSAFPGEQTLYSSCAHVRNPWWMIAITFPSGKEWTSTIKHSRMEGNWGPIP